MRYALLLSLTLMGCGTGRPMTNQEIVREVKYCRENGLKARYTQNAWTWDVTAIHCIPDNPENK